MTDPIDGRRRRRQRRRAVLVLGAGMSGLACARELRHRGHRVLLVEARRRAGGRLHGAALRVAPGTDGGGETTHVDLGGALIHGVEDNPVAQLVAELGVPVRPVGECLLLDYNGWPVDPREDDKVANLFNECLDAAFARIRAAQEGGSGRPVPAQSFGDLFRDVCEERHVSPSMLLQWHQANLEVSCGAGFDNLGYAWNDDEAYGFDGDHVAIQPSWRAVVESLAEGLDILYDAPVTHIQIVHPALSNDQEQTSDGPAIRNAKPLSNVTQTSRAAAAPARKPSEAPASRLSQRIRGVVAGARRSMRPKTSVDRFTVERVSKSARLSSRGGDASSSPHRLPETTVHVTLENGTVLQADAVVCTLPLGILKSGSLTFDPPLPARKQQAIERLGVGLLNKCVMSFSRAFWQDSDFLGLASKDRAYLVLNGHKYTGQPILIFMYGGDFAKEIQEWTDKEIVDDCLERLKTICGKRLAPLVDYRITRWGKEQYSRMSFSYVPPGIDGQTEYRAMSEPILNVDGSYPVLMFAGEHTIPYHPSTIHGAFLSGIREAYRLDCTLFPEANGGLKFNDGELYARTFALEMNESYSNGINSNGKMVFHHNSLKSASSISGTRLHRRRGAARVVGLSERTDAATSSGEAELASTSRRSHREKEIQTKTVDYEDGYESDAEGDVMAREGEQLMRGIDSYGRDYAYLQTKVLPVYGGRSQWTLSQVKKRTQSIVAELRKMKPRSSSTWKQWIAQRNGVKKMSSFRSTATVKTDTVSKTPAPTRKLLAKAAQLPKITEIWTVTRSGRKVKGSLSAAKRPNGSLALARTRSGRNVKKPRIL